MSNEIRLDRIDREILHHHASYEAFLTGKLIGLPGVLRATSHLTMKKIKTNDQVTKNS